MGMVINSFGRFLLQGVTVCSIGLKRSLSEVLESKLVEPKEASVRAVAKVKQSGKFYSGTIVAVKYSGY